jgi:hypothetical protein
MNESTFYDTGLTFCPIQDGGEHRITDANVMRSQGKIGVKKKSGS